VIHANDEPKHDG
jgi:hypothetical protein